VLLSEFNYDLPPELIAKRPLTQRRDSRLLVVDVGKQTIEHRKFTDIVSLLAPHDLLVMNNTKVMAARIPARKDSGGKVSLLIERVMDTNTVLAQAKANKPLVVGQRLEVANRWLTVTDKQGAFLTLEAEVPDGDLCEHLQANGRMPLPPYMQREDEVADRERFQTVYAQHLGAVAAPTAGLHFDKELLAECSRRGVRQSQVTLHVGAGTFMPVRCDEVRQHQMHREHMQLSQQLCDDVAQCRQQRGRVVAVGTTSLRSLESAFHHGELQPFCGDTQLFITPGDQIHVVDVLLTNFHLPKSTLLMLVYAVGGVDLMRRAYQAAIAERYRFYSYGDAMLIVR
jgi:S-adenosylmethionine:tRNA ribosyltransferase-isomerase